jgi:hypothetical protein
VRRKMEEGKKKNQKTGLVEKKIMRIKLRGG